MYSKMQRLHDIEVRYPVEPLVCLQGSLQMAMWTMDMQATVCAKFGLPCIIYMGSKDMERQALNVFRMRLLGAEVRQPSLPGPQHTLLFSFRLKPSPPDMTALATGACSDLSCLM